MPYWQRVPADLQQQFFDEIVEGCVKSHPIDFEGLIHVPMVRLQVEAINGPDKTKVSGTIVVRFLPHAEILPEGRSAHNGS
jgi:hypothetical protein